MLRLLIAVWFLKTFYQGINRPTEALDGIHESINCADQLAKGVIGGLLSVDNRTADDDQVPDSSALLLENSAVSFKNSGLLLELCLMASLRSDKGLNGVLDPG